MTLRVPLTPLTPDVPRRPPLVRKRLRSIERLIVAIFVLRIWHYEMHYAMSIA